MGCKFILPLVLCHPSLTSRREGAMDEDNGEVVEEPLEENITGQSEFGNTDDHTPTDTEPKVGIENDPPIDILLD